MMYRTAALFAASALALTAASIATPGWAQDVAPQPADREGTAKDGAGREIVVVATRFEGEVATDLPPVISLNESEIASYGVGSISDLLTALAPQTGSGRGRGGGGGPVVLLNGQRVSGFRELRNVPPEAIRKVEVLPEEVARQFGFRPDQRVINFILKDRFSALTAEIEYGVPSSGGYSTGQIEASLLRLDGKSRTNISANIGEASALTEAERGIVQAPGRPSVVAGDPQPAQFRTLLPDTRGIGVNATWARPLGQVTSLSLNGALEKRVSTSRFGLNEVTLIAPDGGTTGRTLLFPGPLERAGETVTASAGAALNTVLGGGWRLAATGDYIHVESDNRTDRRVDASAVQAAVAGGRLSPTAVVPGGLIATFAPDRAETRTNTATSLLTLSGRPFRMPAGDASLTARSGFDYRTIESRDSRRTGLPIALDRSEVSGGLNLDLPLTSRRENVLAGVGDLSLNLNAEVERVSDFGSLVGYGSGLSWSPIEKLSLTVTYIARDAAPGLSDLGGAVLVTPNVTTFDFQRGETALAQVTTGGNPDLLKQRQRDLKIGLNWQLPFLENSNFIAEYFRNRSFDTTNGFPLLTPAIEAAFSDRVTRDTSGRLIAIDQRPVTFAEERSERLRYGFNLSGAFGTPDPSAQRGPMAGLRGGGGGGGGPRAGGPGGGGGGPRVVVGGPGGFGGGFGGGGDGRGRWNLSLYHTVQIENAIRLADNGPLLDLLDGQAISGGGVARHAIELESGGFYRGFGLRLSGSYTGGSTIDGSPLTGSSALAFAPFARFNARLFADLNQRKTLVEAVPFLKHSRISLRIDNLFDAQQRVTDDRGLVPLRYQPGFQDSRGRFFEIEFRKQF